MVCTEEGAFDTQVSMVFLWRYYDRYLFSSFPIVACGVSMSLIGLVIYVWAMQQLLVSIISTIPFVVLSPLVAACFYPHSGRKHDILVLLVRKRGT